MLVMGCDQCCEQRRIDDRIYEGFVIGCFPNLYGAIMDDLRSVPQLAQLLDACVQSSGPTLATTARRLHRDMPIVDGSALINLFGLARLRTALVDPTQPNYINVLSRDIARLLVPFVERSLITSGRGVRRRGQVIWFDPAMINPATALPCRSPLPSSARRGAASALEPLVLELLFHSPVSRCLYLKVTWDSSMATIRAPAWALRSHMRTAITRMRGFV